MTDIDKVKQGLECCDKICGACPYLHISDTDQFGSVVTCDEIMMKDALAIINKLQEELMMMKMIYGDGVVIGQIVRCKDCVSYNHRFGLCINSESVCSPEFYCADGVRKYEGTNRETD